MSHQRISSEDIAVVTGALGATGFRIELWVDYLSLIRFFKSLLNHEAHWVFLAFTYLSASQGCSENNTDIKQICKQARMEQYNKWTVLFHKQRKYFGIKFKSLKPCLAHP